MIPTTNRHIYVVNETSGPPGFERVEDYDLNPVLPDDDVIVSALPDFGGNIWFAARSGRVGFVDPADGSLHATVRPGEGITNSFAIDEDGGVYIVTDRALYRFEMGENGEPEVVWREEYPNLGVQKPGQVDDGSGTTPSLMGADYVAITDNTDPMKVLVYRRGASVTGDRLVCEQSVFEQGRSATDNSLIATDTSIVVENNYGYEGPQSTEQGGVTAPGVERVDLDPDGQGCSKRWESDVISPTVVPKLSLANGLVYVYAKKPDSDDPWYLTAIDFRTGETVYQQLAGVGLGFNNNYAPITIGPDGSAYVGVLDGLVRLYDTAEEPGGGGGGGPGEQDEPDDRGRSAGTPGRKGRAPAGTRAGVTADFGGGEDETDQGPLPFTGLALAATLLAASGLLGGGYALRRVARRWSG